jgi:hypothetical protein
MSWRRVLAVGVVLVGCALAAAGCGGCGCFYGKVPEFLPEQLMSAAIERPPGTLWTTIDLSEPDTKEEVLAAYAELYPWVHERAPVHPDAELRLQLADGRTIGVAVQEGDPEMLVRVYRAGEIQSELHVAGRPMYDLLFPESPYP